MTTVEIVQQHNKEALKAIHDGEFETASRLLHEAVSLCGDLHHRELAASLNNLGCLAKRLGKHIDAKRYIQDAVNAEVAAFGEPMLSTQLNLSTIYTALNDVPAAILLAQQVVDRTEPVQGQDFHVVALHNLAVAQLCSNDVKVRRQGLETLKRALQLGISLLGETAEVTQAIQARLTKYHRQKQVSSHQTAILVKHQPTPPTMPSTATDTRRSAASRALRALDFATPTEEEDSLRKRKTSPPMINRVDGNESGLPSRAQVMAGTTFVDGPAIPPSDGKPLPPSATQSAQQSTSSPLVATLGVTSTASSDAQSPSPAVAELNPLGNSLPRTPSQGPQQPSLSRVPSGVPQHQRSRGPTPVEKEKTFLRFVSELRSVPPPVPVSFKEVKAEIAIRNPNKTEAVPQKIVQVTEKVEQTSIFRKSVKEKSERQKVERLEEQQLAARQKHEAEIAAQKAAYAAKLARAEELRRWYAARTIQRAYLNWRIRVPPARRKRAVGRTIQNQKDVGRARLVRRYANRWLQKTAGQRLLARLLNSTNIFTRKKVNYETVVKAVVSVQRVFRLFLAKRRRRELVQYQSAELQAILKFERLFLAAATIQRWVRQIQSRKRLRSERAARYTGYILVIQRWGRSVMMKHKHLLSVVSDSRRRHVAATRIQTIWRGKIARLTASLLRLKKKIHGLRLKEIAAARTIQKAGRGYFRRYAVGDLLQRYRASRLVLPANLVADTNLLAKPNEFAAVKAQDQAAYKKFENRETETAALNAESRGYYLDLVVRAEADAIADRHRQHTTRLATDRAVATERNRRQAELDQLRADRAAKCIQRRWRRWWYTMSEDRRQRQFYLRAEFAHAHYLAKEKALEERLRRERLRLTNDLAKDAREEKVAAASEAIALQTEQFLSDRHHPHQLQREVEEREAEAKRLKQLERDLLRTIESEKHWLRTLESGNGVRTFRTLKEKRQEDEYRRRANDHAEHRLLPAPVAAADPSSAGTSH